MGHGGYEISLIDGKMTNYTLKGKDIVIEDNAWLGAGVYVIDGNTIGKGSVIGAGAVVTKDIPKYSIAVGVPAKVIKSRGYQENKVI